MPTALPAQPVTQGQRRKTMSVDQKSFDLAEYFMTDVKNHTAAHVRELAEAIQTVCEDHCSMAEADVAEIKP